MSVLRSIMLTRRLKQSSLAFEGEILMSATMGSGGFMFLVLAVASLGQEFLNGPGVIGESRFHRRSDPKRLMDATEVVKGHVKRNSRLQIVQLFTEGVG